MLTVYVAEKGRLRPVEAERLDVPGMAWVDLFEPSAEEEAAVERALGELRSNRDALGAQTQKWQVEFSQQRDRVSLLEPPTQAHESLLGDWLALASTLNYKSSFQFLIHVLIKTHTATDSLI